MAEKNLHDIKIDELDSPKKTPLKNILTLLALLFIILVISVVITKLILKTDDGKDIETNSTSIIKSTETIEEINKTTEVKTHNVVPVLSSKVPDRNLSSATKSTLRTHTPVKEVKETKAPKTYKEPKKTTVHKEPKKTTPKNSTPKKEYIDKVVTKRPAPVKKTPSYMGGKLLATTHSYYIKVGTYKNSKTIVNKIKKINYNYSIQKLKDDATLARVYVGPFFSQNEAEKNLNKIKNSVLKSAYVQKVKP